MVRKRKIPVRKHHGIRDPLQQIEVREKKLAKLINAPPTKNGNDEQVTFKFRQFKKIADAAKVGKKLKHINSCKEDKPKNSLQLQKNNKFKNIKQFHGESDENYLRRVKRMTNESVREAHYEAKYGVNVIRDSKSGAITIQKRPKNEIDELLKQKQKEQRNQKLGKKNKVQTKELMEPKVAKELIKRALKEPLVETNNAKPEYQQDFIRFGEIVHGPPTMLTLPRKAAKNETVPRPGQKNNLLLKDLLNKQTSTEIHIAAQSAKKSKPKVATDNLTKAKLRGKRKELPEATRNMLESERMKFVNLYRTLKKSKIPGSNLK